MVGRALRDAGFEVVLLGMARASDIAAVARDEDADLVGLNVGGSIEVVMRILDELEQAGVDAPVLAGGTIPPRTFSGWPPGGGGVPARLVAGRHRPPPPTTWSPNGEVNNRTRSSQMDEGSPQRHTVVGRATIGDQLRRHAQQSPDHAAVVFYHPTRGREVHTYGSLNTQVNRFAAALAGWGVGRGDVVAVMSRNSPDYIIAYYAALNWAPPSPGSTSRSPLTRSRIR